VGGTLYRDIYYARSVPVPAVLGVRRVRAVAAAKFFPATGLSGPPLGIAVGLFGLAVLGVAYVRRTQR
jgi:hypothetical protein